MIVDTSAIIALIQREDPHAEQVAAALANDHSPVMAAPSVVECLIVLTHRHGPAARLAFDRLRTEISLDVVAFTADHAAAKLAHEPLVAVGNDFAQTDLEFDGVIGYWPRP